MIKTVAFRFMGHMLWSNIGEEKKQNNFSTKKQVRRKENELCSRCDGTPESKEAW